METRLKELVSFRIILKVFYIYSCTGKMEEEEERGCINLCHYGLWRPRAESGASVKNTLLRIFSKPFFQNKSTISQISTNSLRFNENSSR